MSIQLLPEEIVLYAFSYLPTWDLISISHASSSWRSLAISDPRLWTNLVVNNKEMLDSLASRSGTMAMSLDLLGWKGAIRPSLHDFLDRIVGIRLHSYMLDDTFMRLVFSNLQALFVIKSSNMHAQIMVTANWARNGVPNLRQLYAPGVFVVPPGFVWHPGRYMWLHVADDTIMADKPPRDAQLENLQELTVNIDELRHVPKLFSMLPNIVTMRLSFSHSNAFGGALKEAASLLKRLERLQLDFQFGSLDWTLSARSWNPPNLTSFVLTSADDTFPVFPRLTDSSEHPMLQDKLVRLSIRRSFTVKPNERPVGRFAIYRSTSQNDEVSVHMETSCPWRPTTLELIARNREVATIVALDLDVRAFVEAASENLAFPAVTSLVITTRKPEEATSQWPNGAMRLFGLKAARLSCGCNKDDDHDAIARWFSSCLRHNISYGAKKLDSVELQCTTVAKAIL